MNGNVTSPSNVDSTTLTSDFETSTFVMSALVCPHGPDASDTDADDVDDIDDLEADDYDSTTAL